MRWIMLIRQRTLGGGLPGRDTGARLVRPAPGSRPGGTLFWILIAILAIAVQAAGFAPSLAQDAPAPAGANPPPAAENAAAAGNSAAAAQSATGIIKGTVISIEDKELLSGVALMLGGRRVATATDERGQFIFTRVPSGTYELRAILMGYVNVNQTVTVVEGQPLDLQIRMKLSPIQLSTIEVVGSIKSVYNKIPGSTEVLDNDVISNTNPIGVEILRKVSGLNVRDEDGVGLRPNIGVRGLIPTRSGKVLLLEDGIFLVQSPYGDTQTYYHPQISRFQRIEVLKGSGQVIYGPQTIGGVINYVTPMPLPKPSARMKLMGGSRDFFNADATYLQMWDRFGVVANYTQLQTKLTRENTHAAVHDAAAKLIWNIGKESRLSLKAQAFDEVTNQTYSHLTQVEYEENPFQNPFVHDTLFASRWAGHLIYERNLGERGALATNVYAYTFWRHWWRQGSNGGPNAYAPPDTVGVRTAPDPNRADGKNRRFYVVGVEPRVRLSRNFLAKSHELDFGVRAHNEIQNRRQILVDSPTERHVGVLLENAIRSTFAMSAFAHDRVTLNDQWRLSLGLRLENVHHRFEARPQVGQLDTNIGRDVMTEVIPGVGATYNPNQNVTFFGGMHRGFSPPQVQDAIRTDGTNTELGSELSWNYELGMRASALRGLDMQITTFYMDFSNQVIPQSGAGGSGSLFTSASASAHGGLEINGTARLDEMTGARTGVTVDGAFTWLPLAEFMASQHSSFSALIDVKGNRLTYAPEFMVTAGVRWAPLHQADFRLEAVHIGEQFSDDLNTVEGTPSGRQGLLSAVTFLNANAHYDLTPWLTLSLSGKNLADKVYVQDRSRGILVGPSRHFYVGLQSKL